MSAAIITLICVLGIGGFITIWVVIGTRYAQRDNEMKARTNIEVEQIKYMEAVEVNKGRELEMQLRKMSKIEVEDVND